MCQLCEHWVDTGHAHTNETKYASSSHIIIFAHILKLGVYACADVHTLHNHRRIMSLDTLVVVKPSKWLKCLCISFDFIINLCSHRYMVCNSSEFAVHCNILINFPIPIALNVVNLGRCKVSFYNRSSHFTVHFIIR